jgi:hypothetical protein
MHSYTHHGVVKLNGLVDTSQSISDASRLAVRPADDALQLTSLEVGNFEWWYFDVIDARKGYVLKLAAHLGTDPLRRQCYPTVAVVARTPHGKKTVRQSFAVTDLQAAREYCDVKINDALHIWVTPAIDAQIYHLTVRLPGCSATLRFRGQMAGWKPLSDAVPMQHGSKQATFSWVVPLPRAAVEGAFAIDGVSYTLEEALGYHDHNTWQVAPHAKLFMDDVIAHWQWGRFLASDSTVVFMNTCLKTHSIQSCLFARDTSILHSSNNLLKVVTEAVTQDKVLHAPYPTHITVGLSTDTGPWQMVLYAKDVLDRRDLLEGVYPPLQWLIKRLISHPTYHSMLADVTLRIADIERHGDGLYESLCLRSTYRGRQGLK